jgi:hypothetical protein
MLSHRDHVDLPPSLPWFSPVMQALKGSINAGTGTINNWIGVLIVLMAVMMNEGAVDSLQNGLAGAFSSHFLKGKPLLWTRIAVILINIPLIVLGTQGYEVLSVSICFSCLPATLFLPVLALEI